MCGRYDFSKPNQKEFQGVDWNGFEGQKEIRPTNPVPVLLFDENSGFQMHTKQWGFIKYWPGKSGRIIAHNLINAKSEEITSKRSFKKAYETARCIIPMNGWYEWPVNDEGAKIKTWIGIKDRPLFGAAGIYETETDRDSGEKIEVFSMLTVAPGMNTPLKQAHDRAPLLLEKEDYMMWLTGSDGDRQSLIQPIEDQDTFIFKPV